MTIDLIIAGRRIRLCAADGVNLTPDERFTAFLAPVDEPHDRPSDSTGTKQSPYIKPDITTDIYPDLVVDAGTDPADDPEAPLVTDINPDLVVDVVAATGAIPPDAVQVFGAGLMEEVPGGVADTGIPFWEVLRHGQVTYVRVFPEGAGRTALLVIPDGKRRWQIFAGEKVEEKIEEKIEEKGLPASGVRHHSEIRVAGQHERPVSNVDPLPGQHDRPCINVNPLPYPLDGLLLYFLFSQDGDIMIHGSGVVCGGRGWLFTGRSGSGKSTLAGIFDRAGDRVIHDDRLVVRRVGERWVMHSTPVYLDDVPRTAPLDHIWLIRHGTANVSEPVTGAEAVAALISNTIQQNWDREAAARLAAVADSLAAEVRVSRLSFLPDASIRDYLLLRSDENKVLGADTILLLLSEGKSVTITAGGYSMWPAIRPGDRVVITPAGDRVPAVGEIIALRRDGGLVIHRVREVVEEEVKQVVEEGVSEEVVSKEDGKVVKEEVREKVREKVREEKSEVVSEGRKWVVYTRGDATLRADQPADERSVAGVVTSVIRGEREMAPQRRRLPGWLNMTGARIVATTITLLRKG